jgi:hypothetical protein
MKTRFILFVLFGLTSLAHAGKEGHGGSSVVCRDKAGQILSVDVLDLYEAREQYHLTVASQTGTAEEVAFRMLDRLIDTSRKNFEKVPRYLGPVISGKNVLPKGVRVKPVNDVFPAIEPREEPNAPQCKIEPLANYQENGTVLVDGDLWRRLSPTQQAALYLHEAIYASLRESERAMDSRKARRITAHLFALSEESFREWFQDSGGEAPSAPAAVTIEEIIEGESPVTSGDPSPWKAARVVYDAACRKWRNEARTRFAKVAETVYPDCGTSETEVVEHDGAKFYRVSSTGTIHLSLQGHALKIREAIRSPLGLDPAAAPADWAGRCAAWKSTLVERFGANLIHADCGGPQRETVHGFPRTYSVGTFVVRTRRQVYPKVEYWHHDGSPDFWRALAIADENCATYKRGSDRWRDSIVYFVCDAGDQRVERDGREYRVRGKFVDYRIVEAD